MKTLRLRWTIPFLLLLFASLSCAVLGDQNPDPDRPLKILLKDDFSDPESGWNRITTTQGQTEYADGVYRIFVNEPDLDIWSTPGKSFKDMRVEVDALKVGGERDNRFGIICRAADLNSFYTFIISSDGYYGIGKIQRQEYQLIGMQALQPSTVILKGSALNHLRADCIGDTLSLYVNGQKLAEVRDSDFTSGDAGLIAGSYDAAGVDIRFDNFFVYQP